jgi:hypothetical protein
VREGAARGLAGLSVVDIGHITVHLVLLLAFDFAGLTCKATRAASVKASFTPRLRMAEHSVCRSVSEDFGRSLVYADVSYFKPTYQGI